MAELMTTAPGPARRRPRRRQGGGDRGARRRGHRRRPRRRRRGARARPARPRGEVGDRHEGRDRDPALPHGSRSSVPTVAFARLAPAVDFGAKDGPAELVFLIAAPEGGGNTHLQILTKLARSLVKSEFTDSLRAASTPEEVVAIVLGAVGATDAPAAQPRRRRRHRSRRSAPPGRGDLVPDRHRAHLHGGRGARGRRRPRRRRHRRRDPGLGRVEAAPEGDDRRRRRGDLRGRRGRARPRPVRRQAGGHLGREAADRRRRRHDRRGAPLRRRPEPAAGRGRRHRRQWQYGDRGGVVGRPDPARPDDRRLLHDPVRRRRWSAHRARASCSAATTSPTSSPTSSPTTRSPTCRTSQALGLEHVPFDSGLLAYLGAILFIIGKTAFAFFVPALAGYIAYAIADRPGIAPGFVMGGLATDIMQFGTPQTGFLGAIVGGVLAGVVAHWITGWPVAKWARGLMPVLVIPLLTALIAGTRDADRPRQADQRADEARCEDGLERHERLQRGDPRRGPRPDDGLRHGRAAQQGGLLVRGRWCRIGRGPGRRCSGAEDHGRRDAGRHGAADRAGPGHRRPVRACSIPPSARTARPPGCSARRSSPRVRSRSRPPTRCG